MTRTMTITEVKAKLLALVDEVQSGEEIIITRRGVTVARLTSARGPHALKGMFAGVAWTTAEDDDLLTTGERWNAS